MAQFHRNTNNGDGSLPDGSWPVERMCDVDEMIEQAMSASYEVIDKIMTGGELPYMLVVPDVAAQAVSEEFPHLIVYSDGYPNSAHANGATVSCVSATHHNFKRGELVLH